MNKILIAGLWHETNTFSPIKTLSTDFENFQWITGADCYDYFSETNTEIGGAIDACRAYGLESKFLGSMAAVPSGVIQKEAYAKVVNTLTDNVTDTDNVIGCLMVLHGAMVSEGLVAPEFDFVRRLRLRLNRTMPIVATVDFHANLSQESLGCIDYLIGYNTYPHVDMYECGHAAVRALVDILERGSFIRSFHKLPVVTVPLVQDTSTGPLAAQHQKVSQLRKKEGMSISLLGGFPYADVPHLGVTIVGYGRDGKSLKRESNKLRASILATPECLKLDLLEVDALSKFIKSTGKNKRLAVVEAADNVGGGAPGDNLEVLKQLLEYEPGKGTIVIWAPANIREHQASKVGDFITTKLVDCFNESSCTVTGTVAFNGDVRYTRTSSYMTGQSVNLGRTLVLEVGFLSIIITSRRCMPFDCDHLIACGIPLDQQKFFVVKSATAWKAGFEKWVDDAVFVDSMGVCAPDITKLKYRQFCRNAAPFVSS